MKKIVSIVMLLWSSVVMYAQKDVTKFLGIPVDGSKSEMIQKLIEKGYTRCLVDKEVLEGEFNGTKVRIHVVTNNNKVYRIAVFDVHGLNATDIKIRFNRLCWQFQKKYGKYVKLSSSPYTLDDEEDISYEMTARNKRYEAAYYQISETADSLGIYEEVQARLLQLYSKEQSANVDDYSVKADSSNIEADEEIDIEKIERKMDILAECITITKRSVWFMINELSGKYRIMMYYDNEYNRADGEDL